MKLRIVIVGLALTLVSSSLTAASWKRAGLFGADVRAMALDPQNPDWVFLGTSLGEIYASKDGGASWSNPRGANPFPGFVIDNMMVDKHRRIWVAGWGLWGGGLLAVSSDGGVTWHRRDEAIRSVSIRALEIFSGDHDALYVGGLTGLWRSNDDGGTWVQISDQTNIESIAVDPRESDRIFVGTWRQAYRTENGGESWKRVSNGMVLDTDVFTIEIDHEHPESIWLATCGWVYHSADGGDRWTRRRDGFDNRRVHKISIDPFDEKKVLAGSVAGLYRTENQGKSWARISDDRLVINSIVISAKRPGRIILGTEGDGVYVSMDGGKSFERSSNGLYNVRVAAVSPDPVDARHLYAAVSFSSSASGFYESMDRGETWSRLNKTQLPEVLALVVRGEGESRFVAGTERGFYISADGIEWTERERLPVRVNEIVAYREARLFAATSEGIFTSKDGGLKWSHLPGADENATDIELGTYGGKPALYVVVGDAIDIFDGRSWNRVEGVPEGVSRVGMKTIDGIEVVLVTGKVGLEAGTVDGYKWTSLDPDSMSAKRVAQANDVDRAILSVRNAQSKAFTGPSTWKYTHLPMEISAITSIVADPLDTARLYFATHGDGIHILVPNEWETAAGSH